MVSQWRITELGYITCLNPGPCLDILTDGNFGVHAGWSLSGPSVAGSVVRWDPSQHRDQLSQRRMGRDWDVLGKS